MNYRHLSDKELLQYVDYLDAPTKEVVAELASRLEKHVYKEPPRDITPQEQLRLF